MSNIRKRLAKAEAQTQSREKWINERKAKLQEIQRLNDGGDVFTAYMLQRELETGRKYSLALVMAELADAFDTDGEKTA